MTSTPTTTFRRRFGAVSLVAATVAFTIAEMTYPTDGGNPAEELGTFVQHHGQLLTAVGCSLMAGIFFVPALFSLMNPLRGRGTVLGHLGGGLAVFGVLSTLALTGVQFIFYEASAPDVDREAVSTFIGQATSDPAGAPLVLGHNFMALGFVLLAIGLYRARVGYRWSTICLGLTPIADIVLGIALGGSDTGELVAGGVSNLLFLSAAAGLAWWQLTTTDDAWEGIGAASRDPGTASAHPTVVGPQPRGLDR